MFNKAMKVTKKHVAMFLAAAVAVSSVPFMNADAASVDVKENDSVITTVSGDNFTVSNNKLYKISGVSGNSVDEVTLPTVSDKGCKKFVGWEYDFKSISGNEVGSVKAVFETKHGKTETKTTEATCSKDGKVETICSDCKEVIKTDVIKATEKHNWDEGKVTKEPTVAEVGEKTYTCKDCQTTKKEEIAKVEATVKLNVKKITLQTGKSTKAVVASGLQEGDKVASWTSSDSKIVKVSKTGKITATKKVGKATVTVKTKYGATATVTVTTQKKAVALKSISVNKKKVTLKKGESFKLVVTKKPITAQNNVTFKSSNKKVVTVTKKGVIKAKKAGKATITVKAGKKTAKVKVTVKKK